ncbi:hypothetical protein L6164_001661 [Bauhinia variegata]|uniref:Uncharacterized protein n=1 Tax=Bauhinia variegata TaxID=167791 RepID=A0ACB9Q9P8_BAUVA|nr:hypothetical protein L6164_001661 [Bauhinia variegata]
MEKVCEFCTALRPIVYCRSDGAYLCLSCDAKVHFANALSRRHLRALVCDVCRYHLAYVQCLNHQMLICRGCDQKLHNNSTQHQRRPIRSYMGCPSAKDFAALWGFQLNEIENNPHQDQLASNLGGSADFNAVNISEQPSIATGGPSMESKVKLEGGSSSQHGQIQQKDQDRKTILQQIVELKRLQLGEERSHPSKIIGIRETDLPSSLYRNMKKLDERFDQAAQNSKDLATDIPEKDNPMAELKPETVSSTFSELDDLSSSSIIDLPSQGEFFWTCRSPIESNQLWSQNIEDLGICEELISQDDFNMPDIDLTFQNFEELFGGDQDQARGLLYGKDFSCSSFEKDMSLDKSDTDNASAMEDTSAAASITITQSGKEYKDISSLHRDHPRSKDPSGTIRPSKSTISLSVSRFSAESSGTYHQDSGLSLCNEGKVGNPEAGGNASVKYKDKKARAQEKHARYPSWKSVANVTKRVKGQVAKAESF